MVELVKARVQDAAEFAALERLPDTDRFILPNTLAEHREQLCDPSLIYLRILHGALLIGFILLALDDDGRSVEFRRIVVASRGNGFGQQAIRQMEDYCQTTLGRTRIWLDVFAHNERARHIYKKLAYQEFGTAVHHSDAVLVLYEKLLASWFGSR